VRDNPRAFPGRRRPGSPALVLDAGPLLAVDRNDRNLFADLRAAYANGVALRTTGVVVAQVWRNPAGRQANLARILRAVDVWPVDDELGRAAGVLLGAASLSDAVDATVVALAADGDRILTSDVGDLESLVAASGRSVTVVSC
jgi:hypothetical protein